MTLQLEASLEALHVRTDCERIPSKPLRMLRIPVRVFLFPRTVSRVERRRSHGATFASVPAHRPGEKFGLRVQGSFEFVSNRSFSVAKICIFMPVASCQAEAHLKVAGLAMPYSMLAVFVSTRSRSACMKASCYGCCIAGHASDEVLCTPAELAL